jgi:hypothetical protein
MTTITPFSGSYHTDDVAFLLRRVSMDMTPVAEKERLIQSGQAHYSDMLSQEPEPSEQHLAIFQQALEVGAPRLARDVMALAKALIERMGDQPIVLASLVRAGVPLGVLLHKALGYLGKTSYHYGISIIRDRGIDEVALDFIEQRHGTEGVVFVDGWTGKGAITGQLTASLNNRSGYPEQPRLVVLADPCGCAWLSASDDDWLIPFGILGAPVSGMVSRSIWSADDLHGCVQCDHLQAYDCSRTLIEQVSRHWPLMALKDISGARFQNDSGHLLTLSRQVVSELALTYDIDRINRIKPGIAEATRAVLRRVPDHILVRDKSDPDVALLVHLAEQKQLPIEEVGQRIGQYRAVTIIKKVL